MICQKKWLKRTKAPTIAAGMLTLPTNLVTRP